MKNWYASLILLVAYLGIFRFWVMFPENQLVYAISGVVVTAALAAFLWWAGERRYFRGAVDYLAHAIVVLDILAEGLINPHHGARSGIWCAIAFAAIIGSYHAWRLWVTRADTDYAISSDPAKVRS